MEVIVKTLISSFGTFGQYAVVKAIGDNKVKPGDLSFNTDGEIFIANQSTCIWCDWKVIGKIPDSYRSGDKIKLSFRCLCKPECKYPSCTNTGECTKINIGFNIEQ